MNRYSEKAVFVAGAEGTRSKFGHTFADTAHIVREVPSGWVGRRVRFTVTKPIATTDAAAVWLMFGTSASIEVDATAVSAGTPPAWTSAANLGDAIQANGASLDIYIERSFTHFSAEADTAGITLTGVVSDLETIAPSKIAGIR